MITKRQQELLKMIVEEYVKTARPVGSKNICEVLKCSSATVRAEMAELEELGYLEKTHTSSGRIPSEIGYRYYVDNLMKPKEMTGEEVLKLQTIFHNRSLGLSDVITKSMEIISEITNYASVVLGSNADTNKLKKVEVVPLEGNQLLAILVTDKGHVEHRNLIINEPVSFEEIKKMVDLINNLLIDTPIDSISIKLEYDIKPIIGLYIKQHEMIYQAFYNAFSDFSIKNNVHMAGKVNMLNQPEFDDVSKIKDILGKFEDVALIDSIKADSNDINIYIGKESHIGDEVTVIKTKYTANGEEGTIAIIGPKRMEYDRVIALLEYIKENIEVKK